MEMLKDINPATGQVIAEYPLLDPGEAHAVVLRARNGFAQWSQAPLKERLRVLAPFPARLRAAKDEIGTLIAREMGRPLKDASAEAEKAAETCEFMLSHAEEYLASEIFELEKGLVNELEYIPMGVVLTVSPWNYPLQLALYSVFPALLSGNAVIHKPSRNVPQVGMILQKLFDGLVPADTVQTMIATSEVAQKIIEDDIQMVALIGSTEAGRDIMRRSAARLLNISLELGGKDAFIVLDDANLLSTVRQAVGGSLKNAGQACNAVERIYVPAALHDQFVALVVEEVKKIKVGDPMDDAVTMGPLALEEQLETVSAHIADAVGKGARVVLGGKRIPGPGYFFEPTVLTRVNHTMEVMMKETFGPVVAIQPYRDLEEAIALANDNSYGLTASVWTRDSERGKEIARRLHTGCAGVNHLCRSHPAAPWGGVRMSGVGRTLGKYGFRTFSEIRNLRYHTSS